MTGLRSVSDGVTDYKSWASDPRPRIGLGLPFYDNHTKGGLAMAECALVLAYSSVGKTALGLNAIAANPDVATLFVSLEMSWRQVIARLTAITTGVPTWGLEDQFKQGQFPPQLYDTMQKFPKLLGNDKSDLSIKDISAAIKQAGDRLNEPIRLVVIDYLELIAGSNLVGKSEQVDRVAVKIRSLAKDNDCSVIALHQVGKTDGSGGYEPLSLDSGKYGGHQPFDSVVGMYSPRLNRQLSTIERQAVQSDLYLQLLKNRNGQAEPDGVKHRLSPETGKITPFGLVDPSIGFQPDIFIPPYEDRDEHSFDKVWN